MHKLFVLLPILFISIKAIAADRLYRPPSETLNKSAYEIDLQGRYFSSLARYDSSGNEVTYDEGEGFSLMDGDINLSYGLSKNLELRLGARFRQVTADTTTTTITNSGAESLWAGAKYSFKRSNKTSFAFDLQYRVTAYTNVDYAVGETLPDEQVLGDSGSEIQVGGYLTYYRNRVHHLSSYLGYRIAPNNLSPEVPYDLQSMWAYSKWAMFLGLKGIKSLGGDEYSDAPELKTQQATHSTSLFNSINREYMQPYFGARYAFKKFRVGMEFGRTLSGVSTDQGFEVIGSLVWSSAGESKEESKLNRFKEYDIEATVLKVSPRGKFVKIDKGLAQDVEKGIKFDIYQTDYFGGNLLVATGIVFEVGSDWAIIKLAKRYKKSKIKPGFVARGYE